VVEFHDRPGFPSPGQPFPVEYKRGRPKRHDADRVQLCAQALCLEEMLGVPVPAGALYYGRTRRRVNVSFDCVLRDETERAAARLHQLVASGLTPLAVREPKCESCSLLELCLPGAIGPGQVAQRHLERALTHCLTVLDGPEEDW
jgi:CRISPR-associated exonuclease Cas4